MGISAGQVKELRDKTGAGMMDCKTALVETGGDMEGAVDHLLRGRYGGCTGQVLQNGRKNKFRGKILPQGYRI